MTSNRDRFYFALILLAMFAFIAQAARHTPAYTSMEKKITILETNDSNPPAQPQGVVITQDELNAFMNEGGVTLPKGLSDVKFDLRSGIVHATSKVDFDTLSEGQANANPIFSALFTGTHDVDAEAQASGSGGQGTVTIQSVKLDGMQVPKSALEYLVQHYVKPRYPQAGMTTTFDLPARIDSAVVQQGQVELTQK
jgi:hypothetical protein